MASVGESQTREEKWRRGRKGGQGRGDGESGSVVSRLQPCTADGALTIDLVASASSGRVAHAEATVGLRTSDSNSLSCEGTWYKHQSKQRK